MGGKCTLTRFAEMYPTKMRTTTAVHFALVRKGAQTQPYNVSWLVKLAGYFLQLWERVWYKVDLRNVSTFFQEETFWASPSTPPLPRSYLLLSYPPSWVRAEKACLSSFVLGVSSSVPTEQFFEMHRPDLSQLWSNERVYPRLEQH